MPKEIKAVINADFYPDHFFNESLSAEAKASGFDGEAIKELKEQSQKTLERWAECGIAGFAAERQQLAEAWFAKLGFSGRGEDRLESPKLKISGHYFTLPIYKRLDRLGDGKLWLIVDSGELYGREGNEKNAAGDGSDASIGHLDQEAFYLAPANLVASFSNVAGKKTDKKVRNSTTKGSRAKPRPRPSWQDALDAVFDSDHCAAEWVIIHQGTHVHIVERGKWQVSNGYLTIELAELFALNHSETYGLVESLLSPRSFALDNADCFHERIEQEAHKKAASVTKALRDTVKESIELLATEVIAYHDREGLEGLSLFDLRVRAERDQAAKAVFDQSLRYIFRMLFILFAESKRGKSDALPVQSRPYYKGLSIEQLRELENVTMMDASGNFIQQTLEAAFGVYFNGYHADKKFVRDEHQDAEVEQTDSLGFAFPALGTALFNSQNTPLLRDAHLSDGVLQQVIKKLSLAKTGSGKKTRTYRVHYAGLGLNQLGAVYEGLLSLKPEILGEDVYLLKRDKSEPASRYIPVSQYRSRSDRSKIVLAEGENGEHIVRKKDGFIISPVGLERKFSASFYTPEVLTQFLVAEALDELLGQNPSLEKMESLKICEPAMGSGAFLNAVVDQIAPKMAQHYRKNAQKCNPDQQHPDLAHYIQQAKQHLMNHCVYGVDLNATAVELAKVSLWLNCLHRDGNLPFLDFKLKHGNSLVGCWVNKHQVDGIPHFLLPHKDAIQGIIAGLVVKQKSMPFVDQKEQARLKNLQQSWSKLSSGQTKTGKRLQALAATVGKLYQSHLKSQRDRSAAIAKAQTTQEKKQINEQFIEKNNAYNQLRAMMDYWCSLWFWRVADSPGLPEGEEYLAAMEWIANTPLVYGPGQVEQLKSSGFAQLIVSRQLALENKYFHWDLEYASVLAEGEFDLVLGNPPWAPVRWEEKDFFEMIAPGMHAVKKSSKQYQDIYLTELDADSRLVLRYMEAKRKAGALGDFLKGSSTYPFKDSSSTNTYRYFWQRFLVLAGESGVHAMIAQDGIVRDRGCLEMRPHFYRSLKRMYRFINELRLFEDVDHNVKFLMSISAKPGPVNFVLVDNVLTPQTIIKSKSESAASPYPGLKDQHGWDLRGHPDRLVQVSKNSLQELALFAGETLKDPLLAKLPIIHGAPELKVLAALAKHPAKIVDLRWCFYNGFHEAAAPRKGLIKRNPAKPRTLRHAVMTGPNIFVGNPANKYPNPKAANNLDFSKVHLDSVRDDFFPDTVYQCTAKGLKSAEYNAVTPWGAIHNEQYRIVARCMVSVTGVRTLTSAIVSPGPSHINGLGSLSFEDVSTLLEQSGLFHSLLFDFLMRSTSGGNITKSLYEKTPALTDFQKQNPLVDALKIRTLRLNCISTHYAGLWQESWDVKYKDLVIQSSYQPELAYKKMSKKWQRHSCIRDKDQREQALCEIDAIVAYLFGFEKETLLNLYRAQFGVLQGKYMQDFAGQEVDSSKPHFPRYEQMSEAYDQVAEWARKNNCVIKVGTDFAHFVKAKKVA